MNRTGRLQRRIRLVTLLFMAALVLSGATAIPLVAEVDWLVKLTGPQGLSGANLPPSGLPLWLMKGQEALHQAKAAYPSCLWHGLAGVRAFCHRARFHRRAA
jgi:hypothetical protein